MCIYEGNALISGAFIESWLYHVKKYKEKNMKQKDIKLLCNKERKYRRNHSKKKLKSCRVKENYYVINIIYDDIFTYLV